MFRRNGRGRLLLLAFVALSIVLITLDFRQQTGVLDRAKEISTAIVAPIQRGLTATFRPVGNFFSSVGDLSRLRSENQRLSSELERIEAQVREADAIAEENKKLTQMLNLSESWAAADKISAQVIGRVPSNYTWAVFIDKGSDDGVTANMPVIAPKGLVGKVVRAEAHRSTVLLLVDPQAAAGARGKRGGDTGVVKGNGVNEPLSLEFISKDSKVKVGEQVVTSGYDGGVFPPAIPIGKITRVAGDSARLDQEIDVAPFVRFTALDYVQVLLQIGPPPAKDKKGPGIRAASGAP